MRGLKPSSTATNGSDHPVASFTDAWIETGVGAPTAFMAWESHLLQMRGLKLTWKGLF